MVLNGLLKTVQKIYLNHNIVLWMILVVLPIGVSLFTMGMFSSQIVQHVPIGIVKQDDGRLADRLESKLRSSPVLNIKTICSDMGECEHAVVRGEIQAFIVFPNDMERRALRLEAPVIPVYSSGQNYLTNMFATKEIRSVLAAAGSEMFTAQMEDPVKVQIHSVGNLKSNYQGFLVFIHLLSHTSFALTGVMGVTALTAPNPFPPLLPLLALWSLQPLQPLILIPIPSVVNPLSPYPVILLYRLYKL